MKELEHLHEEVTQTQSVIDSAVLMLSGLALRLRDALMQEDIRSEIEDLAHDLDDSTNRLATAIAENTAAAEDSDEVYDTGEQVLEDSDFDGIVEGESGAEPSADGDTSVVGSTTERAGTGVVDSDTAVDTSATTTEPTYSGENPNNPDNTDSSNENGTTVA